MKQPIVSVIVPVYNVEAYLETCVKSIVEQTLVDLELIFVDDGSTDHSLEILKEYQKKDGRITIIEQQNAGAGAARNNGLRAASGKYLSFLDADDFFERDMLERAVTKLEEEQAEFVVFRSDQYWMNQEVYKPCRYTIKEKAIPPYRPFCYRQLTDNIFRVFIGWAWDKVYRSDFVLEQGLLFQEQRTSNDLLFVFSALICAKRIAVIEDGVLAHQRRGNEASLSNTREKSWFCFYQALTELKTFLIKKGVFQEVEKDFINYALHFTLWNINTIEGDAFYLLYEKLKTQWLCELGLTDKTEDYFYDKQEYAQLCDLLTMEAEEFEFLISVIIPVHNAQDYLVQGLDSILNQDFKRIEIVCIDDCSTDHSLEIVRTYEKQYKRVKVLINEKNSYAGYCRNKGMNTAKGKYLHFLDADDYVADGCYQSLYNKANELDADMIKTSCTGVDAKTGEVLAVSHYDLKEIPNGCFNTVFRFCDDPTLFEAVSVAPWSGIYRKTFLEQHQIRFNHLFCVNDRSFYKTCLIYAEKIVLCKRNFVMHRCNMGSSLVGSRSKHFECQYESAKIIEEMLKKAQVSERIKNIVMSNELRDVCAWYRKFAEDATFQKEKLPGLKKFLQTVDVDALAAYAKISYWYPTYKNIMEAADKQA